MKFFNRLDTAFKQYDLESTTFPDGRRFYVSPEGEKLDSVTTVIGAKKKQQIIEWRNRVGAEEANKISRIASGRGTNLHSLCETYLKNQLLPKSIMPDAQEMFLSIRPILDNYVNDIVLQESCLYSLKMRMAGRVDLIAKFGGKLAVIDFKTSSRIKKEEDIKDYFAQTCAYACMFEEMYGIEVKNLVIIMAVKDSKPLVFCHQTKDNVDNLAEHIEFYRSINK